MFTLAACLMRTLLYRTAYYDSKFAHFSNYLKKVTEFFMKISILNSNIKIMFVVSNIYNF